MIQIIVLLIFLTTSYFLLFRIQIGFALFVATHLLILPIVKVNVGPLDFVLYNGLLFVVWLSFGFRLIGGKIHLPKFSRTFYKPQIVFLSALIVISLFATKLTLGQNIGRLFFNTISYFTLCFIAWIIYDEEKDLNIFNNVMVICVVIMVSYGLYSYLTVSNPYLTVTEATFPGSREILSRLEEERGGLSGRTQGTMYHAITWGGCCSLLFYFISRSKFKLNRTFKATLLILLSLNVILSGSRSALIALIIGGSVFYYYSNIKIKFRLLLYGLMGFVFLIIAIYQIPSLRNYAGLFESTFFFWDETVASKNDISGSSVSMRMDQLSGAFDLISGASFFFGFGQAYIGYYQETFGQHPILKGFESLIFFALVNSGIVGLFLWLYLFYKMFKMIDTVTPNPYQNFDVTLLKAYVVSFFVFSLFTGFMNTQILFSMLFTIQLKALSFRKTNNGLNTVQKSQLF